MERRGVRRLAQLVESSRPIIPLVPGIFLERLEDETDRLSDLGSVRSGELEAACLVVEPLVLAAATELPFPNAMGLARLGD